MVPPGNTVAKLAVSLGYKQQKEQIFYLYYFSFYFQIFYTFEGALVAYLCKK